MTIAISDEPQLASVRDCLDELNKCIHWERQHQMHPGQRLEENPDETPRMRAIINYWRERRMRVEARFNELNDLSRT